MHFDFAAPTFSALWVLSDILKLRLFHPLVKCSILVLSKNWIKSEFAFWNNRLFLSLHTPTHHWLNVLKAHRPCALPYREHSAEYLSKWSWISDRDEFGWSWPLYSLVTTYHKLCQTVPKSAQYVHSMATQWTLTILPTQLWVLLCQQVCIVSSESSSKSLYINSYCKRLDISGLFFDIPLFDVFDRLFLVGLLLWYLGGVLCPG